jgi:hypothetical protein
VAVSNAPGEHAILTLVTNSSEFLDKFISLLHLRERQMWNQYLSLNNLTSCSHDLYVLHTFVTCRNCRLWKIVLLKILTTWPCWRECRLMQDKSKFPCVQSTFVTLPVPTWTLSGSGWQILPFLSSSLSSRTWLTHLKPRFLWQAVTSTGSAYVENYWRIYQMHSSWQTYLITL